METDLSQTAKVLVDGHVHFYSCYDPALFLQSAVTNFAHHGEPGVQKVLCLTESAPDHWFESLFDQPDKEFVDGWRVQATVESNSLQLVRESGELLLVIAGHQVVSCDDLEVLTIGVREKLTDGPSTEVLVRDTLERGGIPVLPWGFGKWLGNRGRIVAQLVEEFGDALLLGDNGGRLRFGPQPKMLEQVTARGQALFSGSDPLPMNGQEHRVGSFGTALASPLDTMQPFASLRDQLQTASDAQPRSGYGMLEAPLAFVQNQFVMQWRKRVQHG